MGWLSPSRVRPNQVAYGRVGSERVGGSWIGSTQMVGVSSGQGNLICQAMFFRQIGFRELETGKVVCRLVTGRAGSGLTVSDRAGKTGNMKTSGPPFLLRAESNWARSQKMSGPNKLIIMLADMSHCFEQLT